MICPKCTAILQKDTKICTNCGFEIKEHPTPVKIASAEDNQVLTDQKSKKSSKRAKIIHGLVVVLGILFLMGAGALSYYYYQYFTYRTLSRSLASELQSTWSETIASSNTSTNQIIILSDEIEEKKTSNLPKALEDLSKQNATLKEQVEKVRTAKAPLEAKKAGKDREAEIQTEIQERMLSFYESYYSYMLYVEEIINNPLDCPEELPQQIEELAEKSRDNHKAFKKISGAINGSMRSEVFDQGKEINTLFSWIRKNEEIKTQIIGEEESAARTVALSFATAWITRDYQSGILYITDALKADPRIIEWEKETEIQAASTKFDITTTERQNFSQYKFGVVEYLDSGQQTTGFFVVVKVNGKWLVDSIS